MLRADMRSGRGADCLSGAGFAFHQHCLGRNGGLSHANQWYKEVKDKTTGDVYLVSGDVRHQACDLCLLAETDCTDTMYSHHTGP